MKGINFSLIFSCSQTSTTATLTPPEIPAIHSASEWEMYKKLINMNPSNTTTLAAITTAGLNKAENGSSTSSPPVTTTPAPMSIHHASNSNSCDLDINDENAPSNFHQQTTSIENNGSDKVIYESPYERPLMSSIHSSQQQQQQQPHHHHHHTSSPSHLSPPLTKMECDEDYATASALQHLHHHNMPYTVHKSIHHMAHYREMTIDDENLENKQQNFAVRANGDEEEPWRPW